MARFSQAKQPRYTTGRRKPSKSRRARSVGPKPARRKGPAPILIIIAVIIALIFCWVFGRGCGGNQEAKENENLRVYTADVNKLIKRSADIGSKFDTLRNGIKDLSRDDVANKLQQMVNDCKEIAKDDEKVKVPQKALTLNPLLQLTLDLRIGGVDKYRASILDVLDKKDTDAAAASMSAALLDLVVSDQALQRFRGSLEAKLKAAKLSFEQVADSVYVPKMDDALAAGVNEYIGEISGAETGNELHGVAVTEYSTTPARVDTTGSGLSVYPYSPTFTVKVTVENQGNQQEDDVPVVVELTQEPDGTPQKKTQKITRLKAGESTTIVFEGLKPVTGTDQENVLKITAGPVPHEKKVDNNEKEVRFVMRAEGT